MQMEPVTQETWKWNWVVNKTVLMERENSVSKKQTTAPPTTQDTEQENFDDQQSREKNETNTMKPVHGKEMALP
jgi:hypothetical protein